MSGRQSDFDKMIARIDDEIASLQALKARALALVRPAAVVRKPRAVQRDEKQPA